MFDFHGLNEIINIVLNAKLTNEPMNMKDYLNVLNFTETSLKNFSFEPIGCKNQLVYKLFCNGYSVCDYSQLYKFLLYIKILYMLYVVRSKNNEIPFFVRRWYNETINSFDNLLEQDFIKFNEIVSTIHLDIGKKIYNIPEKREIFLDLFY